MNTENDTVILSSVLKQTLVVIPAYKEEKHIANIVSQIHELGFIVVVVNDASPDLTAEKAEKAGAIVLNHPFNMGVAVVLQTGYKYALEHGYNYVINLDGDGQHDPNDSIALLTALIKNNADIVIGSRFLNVGHYSMPLFRFIGKNFFSFLIKIFTKQHITDPTSGYRALSHKVLSLWATEKFADEYPDADMLILSSRNNCKIMEYGVTMYPNTTNQSMHSGVIKPLYYAFRMCVGIIIALIGGIKTS